jgi:hypothetical protein
MKLQVLCLLAGLFATVLAQPELAACNTSSDIIMLEDDPSFPLAPIRKNKSTH